MRENRRTVPNLLRGEYIDVGGETEVWRLQRLDRSQRQLVIKNYFDPDLPSNRNDLVAEQGFNAATKETLEQQLALLKKEYGSVIPPWRIVKHPQHPEQYLLVQFFIEGPEGKGKSQSVFEYYPGDIEDDAARVRLQTFVDHLKVNHDRVLEAGHGMFPDLNDNNLVIDAADNVYLIDSGMFEYESGLTGQAFCDRVQIARLDLLAGKPATVLQTDPYYAPLNQLILSQFPTADYDNPNEIYVTLGQIHPNEG